MKIILLLLTTLSLLSSPRTDNDITGRWKAARADVSAILYYKKDNTFDVFVNNKVFASGRYSYKADTLTFVEDNGCKDKSGGNLHGAYLINFFDTDSIQFEVVYDSCKGRKRDLNQLKFGKVEKSLPQ